MIQMSSIWVSYDHIIFINVIYSNDIIKIIALVLIESEFFLFQGYKSQALKKDSRERFLDFLSLLCPFIEQT